VGIQRMLAAAQLSRYADYEAVRDVKGVSGSFFRVASNC
jgi:hypothetical protein